MPIFQKKHGKMLDHLLPELSKTESRVAVLYACGCSRRIIAAEQGISIHTISTYLNRAKDKFDIYSLTELRTIVLVRLKLHECDKGHAAYLD